MIILSLLTSFPTVCFILHYSTKISVDDGFCSCSLKTTSVSFFCPSNHSVFSFSESFLPEQRLALTKHAETKLTCLKNYTRRKERDFDVQ